MPFKWNLGFWNEDSRVCLLYGVVVLLLFNYFYVFKLIWYIDDKNKILKKYYFNIFLNKKIL
jgi:hypothetical protein